MGCPFITGWTETPCDGGACSDAFRLGQCRDAHSPQFCGSAVQFFDLGRLVPPVASRWIGWCSHSHLAGWQTGGCKGAQLHRLTFPRRLAQASPHGDLRAPGSKSRQASQFIGASSYIMFANAPLAKENHMTKPRSKEWKWTPPLERK